MQPATITNKGVRQVFSDDELGVVVMKHYSCIQQGIAVIPPSCASEYLNAATLILSSKKVNVAERFSEFS
jgi:hypothetical protein